MRTPNDTITSTRRSRGILKRVGRRAQIGAVLLAGAFTATTGTRAETGSARISVASVQMPAGDNGGGVELVIKNIERAASAGCRMAVFPAGALGSIEVPGAVTARVGEAARKGSICVVAGCLDGGASAGGSGQLQSTALVFSPEGHLIHIRRKNAGDAPVAVVDVGFMRVGVVLGGEAASRKVLDSLAEKQPDIIAWVNNRPAALDGPTAQSIAAATYASLVAANAVFGGGSMIAQFPSNIIRTAPDAQEAVITGEVDIEVSREARKLRTTAQPPSPANGAGAPAAIPVVNVPLSLPGSPAAAPQTYSAPSPSAAAQNVSDDRIPASWLHWHTDIASALNTAKEQNKRVLVFFSVPSASSSIYIEDQVMRDKNVAARIGAQYVLLRLDMEKEPERAAAMRLGVFRGNVVNIYDGDGRCLGQAAQITSPNDLLKIL